MCTSQRKSLSGQILTVYQLHFWSVHLPFPQTYWAESHALHMPNRWVNKAIIPYAEATADTCSYLFDHA